MTVCQAGRQFLPFSWWSLLCHSQGMNPPPTSWRQTCWSLCHPYTVTETDMEMLIWLLCTHTFERKSHIVRLYTKQCVEWRLCCSMANICQWNGNALEIILWSDDWQTEHKSKLIWTILLVYGYFLLLCVLHICLFHPLSI